MAATIDNSRRLPTLEMAPPKVYEHIKICHPLSYVPTWRKMYLSQPPVTTVMLTVAPYYQPQSNGLFCVMIRDKSGVTMGLVYDTFAATMPAYDASLEKTTEFTAVVAHVCWLEKVDDSEKGKWNGDKGSEDGRNEGKGSGEDGSEKVSSGDESGGDEENVIYDSDGNVMEDASSTREETSSETYEYTEHESELGSDTGFEAADDENLVESHPQTAE